MKSFVAAPAAAGLLALLFALKKLVQAEREKQVKLENERDAALMDAEEARKTIASEAKKAEQLMAEKLKAERDEAEEAKKTLIASHTTEMQRLKALHREQMEAVRSEATLPQTPDEEVQSILERARGAAGSPPVASRENSPAPPGPESPKWTMTMWLQQVEFWAVVEEILSEAIFPDSAERKLELPLVTALTDLGTSGLRKVLNDGNLVQKLAERLHSQIEQLNSFQSEHAKNVGNEKYQQLPTLAYGHVRSFFHGLEGVVGPPSVSLKDAVELEHCGSNDSHLKFEAPNYKTETTSCIEYHFVVHGEEGLRMLEEYPKSSDLLRRGGEEGSKYPTEQRLEGNAQPRVVIPYEEMEAKLNEKNEALQQEGFDPVGKEEFNSARL